MSRALRLFAVGLLIVVLALYGCGDRAMRCTPFDKGFPLCGL